MCSYLAVRPVPCPCLLCVPLLDMGKPSSCARSGFGFVPSVLSKPFSLIKAKWLLFTDAAQLSVRNHQKLNEPVSHLCTSQFSTPQVILQQLMRFKLQPEQNPSTRIFAPVVVEFKDGHCQGLAFPDARSWHWKEGTDTAAEHVLLQMQERICKAWKDALRTIICRKASEGAYKELNLSDFPASLLFGTWVGDKSPMGPTVLTQLTTFISKLQMDS